MILPDARRTDSLEALAQCSLFLEHVHAEVVANLARAFPVQSNEESLPQCETEPGTCGNYL